MCWSHFLLSYMACRNHFFLSCMVVLESELVRKRPVGIVPSVGGWGVADKKWNVPLL